MTLSPLTTRAGLRLTLLAVALVSPASAGMATLRPEAIAAWDGYIAATEDRHARELEGSPRFLSTDLHPDAASRRRALRAGEVLVDRIQTPGEDGDALDMPSAMLHHWRGAVFVPGASLEAMLAELGTGAPGPRQEDVLASRVLARTPDSMRIYLRLQRRKFVTVVFNTEHLVTFAPYGRTRATSRSVATRIAEVENPGLPEERELPPGQDRGFLWPWQAYWRYEQVPGGVIVECESVSLSRDIPAVLRTLAGPLIRSTARESMTRTLVTFRERFRGVRSEPRP